MSSNLINFIHNLDVCLGGDLDASQEHVGLVATHLVWIGDSGYFMAGWLALDRDSWVTLTSGIRSSARHCDSCQFGSKRPEVCVPGSYVRGDSRSVLEFGVEQ